MSDIINNIKKLRTAIQTIASSCDRDPNEITLLAVSKGRNTDQIIEAFNAGISDFGESYFQEAFKKIKSIQSIPINWHFIGPIQSNKCKGIAQYFNWVHSVSRKETAELLNKCRPSALSPINICIQINIDQEITKSGAQPEEALELAKYIRTLPNLKLRGLMAIPMHRQEELDQLNSFLRLKYFLNQLNKSLNLNLDTLSMGMSQDYQAAILAGSTIVRIGSALFK